MQKSSVSGLLCLLKQLGGAYKQLCQYDCREAVQSLENLSPAHSSSNLVLGLLGKCARSMCACACVSTMEYASYLTHAIYQLRHKYVI